jgi:dTDP-4-amino-4,6-dideoxygalactose transaminase
MTESFYARAAALMPGRDAVPVTRASLPPLEEYVRYLEGIWARGHLTNHGPLVQELEQRLCETLGVRHALFVSNGTIALQIALKAVEARGEVITTPFSFVATASSVAWEGLDVVFADVEPDTLTLDPAAVERAITPRTTAILGTHVYGNPCDVEALEAIARRHGLRVIYDAAHAFGVRYKGRAIGGFGDVSTLSFHATKLFHTVEGGAILTDDDELAHRVGYLRNFGFDGPEAFHGVGVNGKNSEFHAAMGLCLLPRVDAFIADRVAQSRRYDDLLVARCGAVTKPALRDGTEYNYSYYPVLFASERALLAARDALQAEKIVPRRYFYPSLSTLPYVRRQPMPVTEDAAARVLCLPLYTGLQAEDQERVASTILEALR